MEPLKDFRRLSLNQITTGLGMMGDGVIESDVLTLMKERYHKHV
jgi:hypothetical protein